MAEARHAIADRPHAVRRSALVLSPTDNVAVAIANIPARSEVEVEGRRLRVREAIELGHKLALVDIAAGDTVTKFGVPIGVATVAIAAGTHVHIHNIKSVYLTNDIDHFE
jgi:altronate dehydratase small subunit